MMQDMAVTTPEVVVESSGEVDTSAVLTPEALDFLGELAARFSPRIDALLRQRADRRERLRAGESLGFLPETRVVREADWKISPIPDDLVQRLVEITGPVDRKMVPAPTCSWPISRTPIRPPGRTSLPGNAT